MPIPSESNQGLGSDGTPSPIPSGAEGLSPSGQGAGSKVSLETLLDKIERITGEVNALKSGKDKGISRVEKEVSDLRETLARYEKLKAKGMSADEAADEIQHGASVQDALRALNEKVDRLASGAGVGSPSSGTVLATKTFVELGLDPSDPDVQIALADVAGKSPEAIELAALRLSRRKAAQPNPNNAQAPVTTDGKAPSKATAEDIERGYLDAVKGVRRGDIEHLNRIKNEWREKARQAGFLLNV